MTHDEDGRMPRSRFDPAPSGMPVDRMSLTGRAFRMIGILCVVASGVAFALGLIVYLSGNELALLLMMLAFAGFVTGIGFLAAARAAR